MQGQLVTGEYSFKFLVDEKTGEKTCVISYPPICSKYHINQIRLYCQEALQMIEDIADIHDIDQIEGEYLEDLGGAERTE